LSNRMSDWGGFSDAELRHLRSGGDANPTSAKPKSTASKSSKKALAAKKTSKPKPAKKLPEEALFPTSTSSNAAKKETKEEIQVHKIDTSSKEDEMPDFIEEEVVEQKKKMDIMEVEKAQREMEEKNKRRRAALSQEILSRQKKAALESKMLATIQEELVKLDNLLNADVAVLRDQIDTACFEFSEANRRFQTAEKEYVDSKFDLQKKTETKDSLTEHLMNLIQANEERKQKKLEELTFKLSMDPEIVAKREAEAAEKLKLEEEAKQKAIAEARKKAAEEAENAKEADATAEIKEETTSTSSPAPQEISREQTPEQDLSEPVADTQSS